MSYFPSIISAPTRPRIDCPASYVPGRNDEQVAKRWKDVLSPELDLSAPWTRDEDEMLLKLHRIHGPKWTLISDAFPKRNGIACRNRHRKWSKLTQGAFTCSKLSGLGAYTKQTPVKGRK
jgi:hypothetical protein